MATEIDPVCRMEVDTDNPPGGASEYEGTSVSYTHLTLPTICSV